jgi:hypothetical protein
MRQRVFAKSRLDKAVGIEDFGHLKHTVSLFFETSDLVYTYPSEGELVLSRVGSDYSLQFWLKCSLWAIQPRGPHVSGFRKEHTVLSSKLLIKAVSWLVRTSHEEADPTSSEDRSDPKTSPYKQDL